MKSITMFALGVVLTVLVGCASLVASAPKIAADGITIYQAAKQISGVATSIGLLAKDANNVPLSDKMDSYAKWADTIAKASAEIQAGLEKSKAATEK